MICDPGSCWRPRGLAGGRGVGGVRGGGGIRGVGGGMGGVMWARLIDSSL